ncbi:MAG TPA: hypothetical protein VNG33_18835 [Polyangiaceae bacterium]|nr:hypothetical protein [Polyangiaceae bacterium]
MHSARVQRTDTKASIWAAGLSFAVAAFALAHSSGAAVALVALACGFSLLFVRLRQARREGDARLGLPAELAHARLLLERGAHRHALVVAHRVADAAHSAPVQRQALELVAWCQLGLGRPEAARNALSWITGAGGLDPWLDVYVCAAVEDACGASLWALHLLERAAKRQKLSQEATLFRIDLNARVRGIEAACSLTLRELGRLTLDDAKRVVAFARAASSSSTTGPSVLALEQALERNAAK